MNTNETNTVLKEINELCGAVDFSSHNQMREAIEGTVELTSQALQAMEDNQAEAGKPSELDESETYCPLCKSCGVVGCCDLSNCHNYEFIKQLEADAELYLRTIRGFQKYLARLLRTYHVDMDKDGVLGPKYHTLDANIRYGMRNILIDSYQVTNNSEFYQLEKLIEDNELKEHGQTSIGAAIEIINRYLAQFEEDKTDDGQV